MTLIARPRLTVWADKSITGEVPFGRDSSGTVVWEKLSGKAIGVILGTVTGADWETWQETVKTAKGPQQVTRYRSARSYRMVTDESVVGRVDVLSIAREDIPTEDALAALAGAAAVAAPVRSQQKPSAQTADLG